MNRITIDSGKFSDLVKVFSIFKDLCHDIDIREGIIRQKTNDGVCVFEIDLSSIIGNIDLPISQLKNKFDIFKSFYGQEIDIINDGTNCKISDIYSSITFMNPFLDLMDNKYIPSEEISRQMDITEESLLMKLSIEKKITERFKAITQAFNSKSITISFNNDRGVILCATKGKENKAEFIRDIILEREANYKTNLSFIPFILDYDSEIIYNVYENQEVMIASHIFKSTISDVNITIYTRSQLVSE
jgi:hypothetical protein